MKKEKNMFKEFLTNNWLFVGIDFVLIFALGCYLWFQNDMANFRQKYAPMSQLDKSIETEQHGNSPINFTDTTQSEVTSVQDSAASKDTADGTPLVTIGCVKFWL